MRMAWRAAAVAAMIGWAGGAGAASLGDVYTSFWSLGDSLSDNGNLFAVTTSANAANPAVPVTPASPPYFNGRFSNGPIWAEAIAANFAVTGNLAFGGANALTNADPVPDLGFQIGAFTLAAPSVMGARPLASLWFGANDQFGALDALAAGATVSTEAVGQTAADAVLAGARSLATLGVGDFLIFNLPDLGAIPAFAGTPLSGAATAGATAFNARLDAGIDGLRTEGLNVAEVDIFSVFNALLTEPAAFGVMSATVPCIIPGVRICDAAKAEQLAFFDPVHPNATIHERVAAEARAALAPVPLPAAGWLLAAALGALAVRARRV